MWIDFDPVRRTEAFHGNDGEYTSLTGLHARNAMHVLQEVAAAEREGMPFIPDTEQFGTGGPSPIDTANLAPIPRADTAAPIVGAGVMRLAS